MTGTQLFSYTNVWDREERGDTREALKGATGGHDALMLLLSENPRHP